jgi:CheY-like chemotaxis protein
VDCERSLALGAVGHISKPLTPRELYRALEAASLTNSSRDGAFHRTAA